MVVGDHLSKYMRIVRQILRMYFTFTANFFSSLVSISPAMGDLGYQAVI